MFVVLRFPLLYIIIVVFCSLCLIGPHLSVLLLFMICRLCRGHCTEFHGAVGARIQPGTARVIFRACPLDSLSPSQHSWDVKSVKGKDLSYGVVGKTSDEL